MIYLDNAATSSPKPAVVIEAVNRAMRKFAVNPGRGGYALARECETEIYECRKELAEFFGLENETQVVFMPNCTTALNTVIKGVLEKGDHVIASSLEHNAVMRPLYTLAQQGVKVDIADVIFGDDEATVRSFEGLIQPNTKLIVCTHASNVTGQVLPISKIGALCEKHGIRFLVDAAQTAGVLPIDVKSMKIDYLCVAAHKGLYAPTGMGLLLAQKPIERTLIEGGTGTASAVMAQPPDFPDRFESGTQNIVGIFGLRAGLDFVKSRSIDRLYQSELALAAAAYRGIARLSGTVLYTDVPTVGKSVPTFSFNLRRKSAADVGDYLDKNGISVRTGLHCAPSAHRAIGTIAGGTVRLSFSAFNKPSDVQGLLTALGRMR